MGQDAKFSRILVAVDGSLQSMKAADYAISLAKSQNSKIDAISIYAPSYFGPHSLTDKMFTKHLNKQIKTHERYLSDVKVRADRKNVNLKSHLVEMTSCTMCLGHDEINDFKPHLVEGNSHIAVEIIEFAKKNRSDLIVIGSRGLTGFKKLLLGSVATTVMAYAPCPVMIIRK